MASELWEEYGTHASRFDDTLLELVEMLNAACSMWDPNAPPKADKSVMRWEVNEPDTEKTGTMASACKAYMKLKTRKIFLLCEECNHGDSN